MYIKGFFRLDNDAKELLELLGYRENLKKFLRTSHGIICYSQLTLSPEDTPFFRYIPPFLGAPGDLMLTEKGRHLLIKLNKKGAAVGLEQTAPFNAQEGKEEKMNIQNNIQDFDQNALINLVFLRDYTGETREFTDEEFMEIKRIWRMIPSRFFKQTKKWGIDANVLIHKVADAWLRIQSGVDSPILVIKKGCTVQEEKEEEKEEEKDVRIELRPLYVMGGTFIQTLEIITNHLN